MNNVFRLPDIEIGRSLGAMAKNYDVFDGAGNLYHFAEGTRIQNAQVFAGKGVRTSLHKVAGIGLK